MKYKVFEMNGKFSIYYIGDFNTQHEALDIVFEHIHDELKDLLNDKDSEFGSSIMTIKIQTLDSENGLVVWYDNPQTSAEPTPIYIVEE